MGSSRSSSLRIDANPPADAGSEQAREAPIRSAVAGSPNAPEVPPPPLGKGKRKINLIKYPKGSDFLKTAVRHAVKVGPSKVGPSYESTFAERYRPLPGVRIWSPDFLTRYATSVPGMVCFFEVAFDNGLRFPLHPFIKQVLQHFHICPSQLAPNGWGILVGLLVFFRDRGLGVPNVALLLHLFNPMATAEGFIYFPRRIGAPLVISDLPSSHRTWKVRYFFVSGSNWEYDSLDREDTLGVPRTWSAPDNLRKYFHHLSFDLSKVDRILLTSGFPYVSQMLVSTLATKMLLSL